MMKDECCEAEHCSAYSRGTMKQHRSRSNVQSPKAIRGARWACLPLIALLCVGCGAKKHLTADQYFTNATQSFHDGALALAIDQFHELLDQYPFSQYNEEAELRIAHAQYLSGNYPEAVVALADFQRRHPTSPHLPFVGYYLGMCYVRQMTTIDRDQTAAQNAESYFVTIAQQYPDSPFALLARQQLAQCRESLARHEMYIANFYTHSGNDKAAEIRLLTMASRYGDTDASADGLLRLGNLYQRAQQDEHAVLAYRALTQLHPRGEPAEVARAALDRLSDVDPPASGDPIDLLLAANGRQRSTGTFETVQVPGLEPRTAHRPASGVGPGFAPPFDPFGRGRGRPY
jgi:outer membrane protein assembly factor BamD